MTKAKRILILNGGWCAERDISLLSGAAAEQSLKKEGFWVERLDLTRDALNDIQNSFGGQGPEVVFNALHGPFGEDGRIQSLLEFLNIPYTHSGVLASALCMDKPRTKDVLSAAGLKVPTGKTIQTEALMGNHPMDPPYVLKPRGDGSSFGVYIIHRESDRAPRREGLDDNLFCGQAMVETFIPGRELTVAVLGRNPLGVTEIIPRNSFYDFESKYADGGSTHVVPAEIPSMISQKAQEIAVATVEALGCRGLARVDFRWDDRQDINGLFILEVNTQPGLTPTSLAPEQAAAAGLSFEALTRWMIEDASCPR